MTDHVGQHFGNYQLVKLLGRGGYAEVYLGKHRYLNSYAALKVLNATLRPGDEQKFLTEAQRLADLRHSNIVQLLDFCIEDGTPVLIMDYAPKGSLRQHYPPGTQIPLTTIVDFVAQIATALQYAHNHHVIHRDVKPENILLATDSHLLLSDFGISLLTPSSQQLSTQDPAGTARYMAPEQTRGKPCFASDQYALAVMVYEWLCGEPPFRGNIWEIWHQHLYSAPPPLHPILSDLPPMLERTVRRALAKKPQDRFVSTQAFAWALAQASHIAPPRDENPSQVTAPLQLISRSLPIAPRYHALAHSTQNNQSEQGPIKGQASVLLQQRPASALQHQNRERMLRRLRRAYSDLMNQSLQGAAWLELGLSEKPDAVQNVTNLLLRIKGSTERHLPPGTSITQTYDDAEHELLILGEPGAGKSTLLLDLAQQLLVRAEKDLLHPLPVILPLSSWAVKRLLLQDWIAEQMAQIYDVPHKLSQQWVQEGGILPLLDGLDEMEETARAECISAINSYHSDHLAQLVVCSRTIEYKASVSRHRLVLQGAVLVQPLTYEDVDAYLIQAGKPLFALRTALEKNGVLSDLATTPLMLNILILTYQGPFVHELSNRESFLLRQVWDDYVERMVERKGKSERYPLEQTRSWLGWLARQMRDHNQTVFYLEHLQPDWLETHQQRTYAWYAIRLPAIVIGALISIIIYTFLEDYARLEYLPLVVLIGGLIGGLWHREQRSLSDLRTDRRFSKGEPGSQIETTRVRWLSLNVSGFQKEPYHIWGKRLAISACIGLIWGLCTYYNYTFIHFPTDSLFSGVVIGLSSLLLQYFMRTPFHRRTTPRDSAPRRWRQVTDFYQAVQGPRALLVAVVCWLSLWLNTGWSVVPSVGLKQLVPGLRVAVSVGLGYGLAYVLISLILDAQMGDIRLTERLRWTWRSLKRGLFKPGHFRMTVLLASITMTYDGLSTVLKPQNNTLGDGLSVGLGTGLSIGLIYWFGLGLFQGIAQERIGDEDRRIANQGIHRSLRNSVILGIIGGVMIGISGIASNGLSFGLSHVLSVWLDYRLVYETKDGLSLNYGLLLGTCGVLLTFLLTGGLAVLRHFIIRLLLWRSRTFPWRASQFLDDAVARFLLRRVGGGYSFAHRLLLDHFADAETEATPRAFYHTESLSPR